MLFILFSMCFLLLISFSYLFLYFSAEIRYFFLYL